MKDRVFIDTNILVYSISEEGEKKSKSRDIFLGEHKIFISSQTINEFINVCFRKNLLNEKKIYNVANDFMEVFEFSYIRKNTIKKAIRLKKKYAFSYWDSLMLASALESKCSIFYSEDLQHNQLIEKRLKIIDPFTK